MNGEQRKVGRPPGPHDDTLSKLLPTALRLFVDEGGGALTPTRLHKETGVGRATIYRNWPEPVDLIEIMLSSAAEPLPQPRLSGDVRQDLYLALDDLLGRFDQHESRALFAACIEYGRHSEGAAHAADIFISGVLAPFEAVLTSAVSEAALHGTVKDLLSELTGPLILEHVVMGQDVNRKRGRSVVDRFLDHHLR